MEGDVRYTLLVRSEYLRSDASTNLTINDTARTRVLEKYHLVK